MDRYITVICNRDIEWSTGNDLADTLERMGWEVRRLHERNISDWLELTVVLERAEPPAAVIWNRTPAFSLKIGHERQLAMLEAARKRGIPTIAYHLDRWWGLKREHEVFEEPFFRCEYVFTADGHDQKRWETAGVSHFWLPPAVAPRWTDLGEWKPPYAADVAFIGTWWGYHDEWGHRAEMIRWLQRYYGKGFVTVPRRGQRAVRGRRLNDVLASVKVIVGDSCLLQTEQGRPYARYCSDRVFETLGRGGFLVHPYVDGVVDDHPALNGALLEAKKHLGAWDLGNWDDMRREVNYWLKHDDERNQIAWQGHQEVLGSHTYRHRLQTAFDTVGLK